MSVEVVFGTGLGDLRHSVTETVLAYRAREELPESSLIAFARDLCDLLTGMARDNSTFVLAPEGAQFYYLLIVRSPTLRLDLPQVVRFPFWRTRRVGVREQMATAAARIACQLADLGTPAWLDSEHNDGPRQPARLDASDLL